MSLPFDLSSTYKHREARTTFPKPLCVSFDAFDTLVTPSKPVAQQYLEIAEECGVNGLSLPECEHRFNAEFKLLLDRFPNYGHGSEIGSSDEWWRRLIRETLKLDLGSEKSAVVCDRVLQHFSTARAYSVFPDVEETLKALYDNDVPMCLSTNTDERILSVLEDLGLKRFFAGFFLLYRLGVEKPSREFFTTVASQYGHVAEQGMAQVLKDMWHVGDSYEKDLVGSARSGWNGVLIDRQDLHKLLKLGQESNPSKGTLFDESAETKLHGNTFVIADNRVVIRSLTELLPLFGITEH